MKKKFRPSEITFLSIGFFLIVTSWFFMINDLSLAKLFNMRANPGDPFQAQYYQKLEPETEKPRVEKPVALRKIKAEDEANEDAIYLLSPASQAIIVSSSTEDPPPPLKFEFEVYPKDTQVHFELTRKGQTILSKDVLDNSQGRYKIQVEAQAPGVYQWQVKTLEKTSELRQLTIKRKHS